MPAIKYSIDNNIMDKLHLGADSGADNTVVSTLRSNRFRLYANPELVEEAISIVQSRRAGNAQHYARFLLDHTQRFFNDEGQIVHSELQGKTQAFMPASLERSTRQFLEPIAAGHTPPLAHEIAAQSRRRKESNRETLMAIQSTHREVVIPAMESSDRDLDFRAFKEKHWGIWKRELTAAMFRRLGAERPKDKAESVCVNLARYPYTATWLETEAVSFYRRYFLNRKVKLGDEYDLSQLVYVTKLDAFVTEERDLREIGKMVFGAGKLILSFPEFEKVVLSS